MPSFYLPEIRIHYLGHASFILFFDNGMTILTDYGQSRAYGLDSPIHDLGNLRPTILIFSHHHADHDRGQTFTTAKILNGEELTLKQIVVKPVPVTEKSLDDNYGYLITYKGVTIFHAGDIQGDIVQIGEEDTRQRLKSRLPANIDLMFVPVGWIRDITQPAAVFVDFLRPRRVIPMHYWSEGEKRIFLTCMKKIGKGYFIRESGDAQYELFISRPSKPFEIISLTAAAYGG
jgi:L-ascorbate metabolism protein UlaG (beta-lactamase superfamily)